VWTVDPKVTPFRDGLKYAVIGDFVVVDMFGEACTGNQKPKATAQRAAERGCRSVAERPGIAVVERQTLLPGLRRIIRHAGPGLRTGMA
jgi:hypothetical protein